MRIAKCINQDDDRKGDRPRVLSRHKAACSVDWVELPHISDRWFSYLLDLERLTLAERLLRVSDMPDGDERHVLPTVYMHVLGGELMYIGQSTNVTWRRRAHASTRDWDDEYVLIAPDDMRDEFRSWWLDAVEYALIDYLKPPYNYRRHVYAVYLGQVTRHLRQRGFALPNGIVVGKRHVPIVQGPTMRRV